MLMEVNCIKSYGNLGTSLKDKPPPTYISSLTQAFAYCYEKDVIRGDIKPENLLIDHEVDNWTFGFLCYEFLYGAPPFEVESQKDKFRRIMKVNPNFPSTLHVSADAKSLMSQLVVKDSAKKLSLQKIMEHPWVVKNADTLRTCSN
ncbi:unnamed protein product [Fraxinus pennsylvanica]|uniref:Protein kinase domain-containing protein n=1 Tax=Fraxinus pennsylvanica TaxID=56036 RepID=A0AAD2E1A4_9LAMI|nr:unnamed protein product [Fraxinus pennsylvanica]